MADDGALLALDCVYRCRSAFHRSERYQSFRTGRRSPGSNGGRCAGRLCPAFSWRGFYLGGELGWIRTDPEYSAGAVLLGAPCLGAIDRDRLSDGVLADYNYQIGNLVLVLWVAGVPGPEALTAAMFATEPGSGHPDCAKWRSSGLFTHRLVAPLPKPAGRFYGSITALVIGVPAVAPEPKTELA